MDDDTTTLPQDVCGPAAGPAPGPMLVLEWQAHPIWPVRHNAARALAALHAGARAVLLARPGRQRPWAFDGHALFPSDLSPSSLASLRLAIRTLPPMRFTLLHGCRIRGEGSMRSAGIGDATLDACRRSTEAAARAAGLRFAAQLRSCDLRPALALLRQPWHAAVAAHAAMARPDVLVLADASGGPWARWRWRADLRALLARTECDLLLLPRANAV
ncbi:MAG: hypothetical protein EOP92_16890 [Lysobacteraceae bacterium]|nr:MAG: hypothetical protein EOP92_16890 [Xanthomonadaceae bacterium]